MILRAWLDFRPSGTYDKRQMVSVTQLNERSLEEFISLLGGVYEHSEWVARRVIPRIPFRHFNELRDAMRDEVERASDAEKLALIQAHPDLAGKLARSGGLTEASTREQAGLGLDRLSDDQFDRFTHYNTTYRERFGFPFIICARKTTQQGVLDAFETRLGNSRKEEIAEALRQIHDIAALRLEDLVDPRQ
jgi:2-oxo-4-hydroxy-4-carboxy-5-ureidoimidazoline decarboxylase